MIELRRRIVATTIAAVALVAAGCGANSEAADQPRETITTTSTVTATPTTDDVTTTDIGHVEVQTGAERLVMSGFAAIAGKRVGLISHQNSVVEGRHLADHLDAAEHVELVALFGPEHGARGDRDAGEYIEDSIDPLTRVPIFSLFGETRQPTPDMLEGIDVLLYDLQDVGARYYTYISTMGLAMQAAASANIEFVVLDRPNPLGGLVGGGVLDEDATSFVGLYPIPDTYGLTAGELALAAQANGWLPGIESLQLSVVELVGWDASMLWDDTGLEWIAPSPALTTADSALVYPATVYLEATSLSYGRGTDRPFTLFGAPWLDAPNVVRELTARSLPGFEFTATTVTPRLLDSMTVEPAFIDSEINAVQIDVIDGPLARPTELGVHLLDILISEGRAAGIDVLSRPEWLDQLSGSTRLREALEADTPALQIIDRSGAEVVPLSKELQEHHLYARSSS
ncbi:MAG: DUF1343 domain-containing protein [Acidimicrobiia bacterium]|nr:DUF1343 domain-containing protein [Acidimicrobiia bacterium]